METFDAVIIGAGAAGLFCASVAGQLGLKVLLMEHTAKIGEKIRISGGGRCNFTNRELDPLAPHKYFLSENLHFCRSALARYTPQDFMDMLTRHGIAFHEKHKGQMFCDHSAADVINMLLAECKAAAVVGGSVAIWQSCSVRSIRKTSHNARGISVESYEIDSEKGLLCSPSVVIATGGLSIPKIGASDFGYRIAQQFGVPMVPTRPALVPLTFAPEAWQRYVALAGLSLPVTIGSGSKKTKIEFVEDLLFTHRGLSGPGVLQISSYWTHPLTTGSALRLNLAPQTDVQSLLLQAKARSRKRVENELANIVPSRLADATVASLAAQSSVYANELQRPISEVSDKTLQALAQQLNHWEITPHGTEGYAKAEVTAGGVDTRALSSQTMEFGNTGLYFIGEVVDVTGWLGGYNFQWAWASAHACAQALAARPRIAH